jgi:hypothetical protein
VTADDTLAAIDEAVDTWVTRDWAVSKDAMRCAPQPPGAHVHLAQLMGPFVEHFRNQLAQVTCAIGTIADHAVENARIHHARLAPLIYGDTYRRHRRNCCVCNPAGNPRPLKVNGADYARRRKARRHR